jgi:antitoxin component YwqK of YwqJK toxin-antitoxin module
MNLKIFTIASFLAISTLAICQSETVLNNTDPQGRKQGHWIKNYSNGSTMYEGYFKDDHPVGEFKRYYENKIIKSLLIYSPDGKEAAATTYHSNGYVSSKGTYINQIKEGKWQFFSASTDGYMISEEYYTANQRNGQSVKFYPDNTIAESVSYHNDLRNGECIQYYHGGAICLKSYYVDGKLSGTYEVWFKNGRPEFSGKYINDVKEGIWLMYNSDGTLKYRIEYKGGVTNDLRVDVDMSDYLDSLEKNKGKIADPEKTGAIW